MRTQTVVSACACLLLLAAVTCSSWAQGVAEKVGEKLDEVGRGIKRETQVIGEGVRKRFDGVKNEVNLMSTHSRVYSRLHWDKALNSSKLEVHMLKDGAVLIRGAVPDQSAHDHAVVLARDTEGVRGVVDELTNLIPATPEVPAAKK